MMTSTLTIALVFIFYIAIVLWIGFYAGRRTENLADYLLGGRHLSGPIVALGAGASDMSSWLLMALPGTVYLNGLNQIWLPIGLSIGAYFNWKWVAGRLRVYTERAGNALTLPAYFAGRFPDHARLLRATTAVVILIFFTFYTSAGFVAGAYLGQLLFSVPYQVALLISAGVIIVYTTIGGFFAISWIDFFQGCLMFLSLLIVPAVAFNHLHGWQVALTPLYQQLNGFFNPLHSITLLGTASLLAWGLGYFGQPHILVRFMAARSHRELPLARNICMLWMTIALGGAVIVGLVGRAFYATPLHNPEEIFIKLCYSLFTPLLAGILLSAIISAIMSTSSAQLLASASALIEDVYHPFINSKASPRHLMWGARLCVLLVALIAYWLATDPEANLLTLVAYAWAGLGASFGPIVLISLFWRRMNGAAAVCGMVSGALTVIVWEILGKHFGGIFHLYSIIPAFALNSLLVLVLSRNSTPSAVQLQTFAEVEHVILEK